MSAGSDEDGHELFSISWEGGSCYTWCSDPNNCYHLGTLAQVAIFFFLEAENPDEISLF